MLPPFIIEQIKQREEEQAQPELQPVLELPVPNGPVPHGRGANHNQPNSDATDTPPRGVLIIEL